MLGEFGEFARRIDAQTRHHSVEPEDQGDDGNHVGPEEARPAEGPQEWRDEQIGNRNQKSEEDGENVPARHLENADALLAIDRVLQDGLSLLRREMVEGSKERAKTVEFRRDFRHVDRVRVEVDLVPGGDLRAVECGCVWVLVG